MQPLCSWRADKSPRRENRTIWCLRLCIGTGELQTKRRKLAPYLSEKPRTCRETPDQEDELLRCREWELG